MTPSTETQRMLVETLNDLTSRLKASGFEGVGKCVERSRMAMETREAARSASGAEFSELHTTRVHVAPAPAETTRDNDDVRNCLAKVSEPAPPHSWSYINTLIGWTCCHCGIADRGPHHSLPISGCGRPKPVPTPPDAAQPEHVHCKMCNADAEKRWLEVYCPRSSCPQKVPEDAARNGRGKFDHERTSEAATPDAAQGKPTDKGLTEDEAANVLHKFRHAHSGSPTTGESGLRVIADILQYWIDFDLEQRNKEGLPTDADTYIMSPPCWPSHGQLANWVAELRNTRSTPRAMAGDARAEELLRLILPLAKGYAQEWPFGSNRTYVSEAEEFLTLHSTATQADGGKK